MKIEKVIELLQHFPQGSYLELHGDRGIEDLRVVVLGLPEHLPSIYKLDEPTCNLPWLNQTS